jgi:hypothetical protein
VITIIYKNKVIRSDVYKNLEYISLLQSRATLAEPSKMHRNRPLAVHSATLSCVNNNPNKVQEAKDKLLSIKQGINYLYIYI